MVEFCRASGCYWNGYKCDKKKNSDNSCWWLENSYEQILF